MKLVLAGSSGFLGKHLRRLLAADGHTIVQLVRREPASSDQYLWWPDRGPTDPAALNPAVFDGVDAVINLAGAGVGDKRWTEAYKATILSSRVNPTATIATCLARMDERHRPRTLINASAVGFYGDTGEHSADEQSPAGVGFFPSVCQAWERATEPARDGGVRTVVLRTGLPLDQDGGLLKPLLLPFRFGLGGPLGTGRQWLPWISLADWCSAVMFVLAREDVAGAVNLVGPAPVRNVDFAKALGAALHRPAVLPVPKVALTTLVGEFGNEAVVSQRVLPAVLNAKGFSFAHPDVASAIRAALRT